MLELALLLYDLLQSLQNGKYFPTNENGGKKRRKHRKKDERKVETYEVSNSDPKKHPFILLSTLIKR